MTLESLRKEGFEAVFIGIGEFAPILSEMLSLHFTGTILGHPQPIQHPLFKNLTEEMGFLTSKDFLPKVARASKPGMCSSQLLYTPFLLQQCDSCQQLQFPVASSPISQL